MDMTTQLLIIGDVALLALLGMVWWQRRHNRPQ